MLIITDEKQIDEVLDRSVDTIYPTREKLKSAMMEGKQLRIYAGVDATGERLHLGHAINYLMLRRFHELGHKIIVLVGDFTATIGDPSDKTATRKQLSKKEVASNLENFKTQIGSIINLEDNDNPVEFRRNSEWLSKLNFADVVDLASNFTVQNMLERDVFERRLDDEKPLYVHEFFYPLMQGYDSVALKADIEIGGTDQTFNMLAGRTLRRRMEDEEKFVITHPLLEDPDSGEMLMSKSEGRGVFLDEQPNDLFAKVMKIPDSAIIPFFTHCTDLTLAEIETQQKDLDDGVNPRDVKLVLAEEIAAMIHGGGAAKAAKTAFVATFSNKETPNDAVEVAAGAGDELMSRLVEAGVVPSKTQFRRLVDQGAITNLETDQKITDHNYPVTNTTTFKVGKHRFVKIIIT